MASAAEHLAQYGVTIAQAQQFILDNMGTPEVIYNVALNYGITSAMLGEIVGYPAAVVENFFDQQGLDGSALRAEDGEPGPGEAFVPGFLLDHTRLYELNTVAEGTLSNPALHDWVVSILGQPAFDDIFDPAAFQGGADGTFSTADLGFDHLGDIAATQSNLESLYYGTVISFFGMIDKAENLAIWNAADPDKPALLLEALSDAPEMGQAEFDTPDELQAMCSYIAFMNKDGQTATLFDGLCSYYL